ncbi:glycosyltransferase [Fusicatenibacter sp.]
MNKLLIIANVSREHIRKFHIPFILFMKKKGWIVDVACRLDADIPEADHEFDLPCDRNPFSGGMKKSIAILKKIINENHYDVVHCNTITGGMIARVAARTARRKGTRVFYTNHGLHYFKGAGLKRWVMGYPMEWILAPLTDVFITINQADYEMVRKSLPVSGNIERIHGIGVELERFRAKRNPYQIAQVRKKLKIEKNEFVLIYVAEITENKNQIALLEVMEEISRKYSDIVLVLAGPDHTKGNLQRIVEKKDLAKRVRFLGWRDDIPELLAMSNVYVASSKSEGLGLNIIEAMASGLPVVALKNRGHNELIQDGVNGFLIEQNDIQKFTERIIELYEDEQRRMEIVKNAQKSIERYETENVLNELWNIYQKFGAKDAAND